MNPLLRLLFVPLLIASAAFVACGGDDDDDAPPPHDTSTLAPTDEEGVDEAINIALAALVSRDVDALKAMASERMQDRLQQFDGLASCVPEGATVTVASRTIRPREEGAVTLQITFEVTEGGGVQEARRDWRLAQAEDGTWQLDETPQCPFSAASQVTDTPAPDAGGEATEPAAEESPTE